MKEPKLTTIKRLFASSGNICAFPECTCPIVEKSGVITGIICHIKARNKGGPRFDPKQSDEERHSYENLILLCSRHSKIIDSQPKKYTVEVLKKIKETHERNKQGVSEISKHEAMLSEKLLGEYRFIYILEAQTIHAENVNYINPKPPRFNAPSDTIAYSSSHRNYIKHLIDRYNEFASQQQGREFKTLVIYSNIRDQYGAKWDHIKLLKFNELCCYLQGRIDRTMIGNINQSKGIKNYSDFLEYKEKYERRKRK